MSQSHLFNFIYPVISGSVYILSGSGITATNIQRGTGSLETPRVELQVSIGAPVDHVHITSPSSSVFDAYEGTLRATVVTNRKVNDSTHPTYVNTIVNRLSNPANFLNVMPNHQILRMKCQGVAQTINNDRTTDISTITIGFLCQIKPASW
jgi:hypothetical protein